MDDKPGRIIVVLTCLAVLALGTPVAAAPQIGVLGASSRTVDLSAVSSADRTFKFPVTVQPLGENAAVKTELINFGRDGRVLEFDPGWLSYEESTERKDRAGLILKIPEKNLEDAGTYTLTVEFWKGTQPAQKEDGTAGEPTNSNEGSLVLTLVRPPGALTFQAPVKIERVIQFPCLWQFCLWQSLSPSSLLLSETSGANFAQIVPPGDDHQAKVPLRSSANSETVAQLAVTLPDFVAAGQQASAALTLEENTAVGSLTGTLRIVSEQLQPRTLTTAIEVVTRLHRIWLLVVIVIGILIGILVRVKWEKSKQQKLARAAALETSDEFKSAIAQVVDVDCQNELARAHNALLTVINNKRSTADDLKGASTTAATALGKILGDFETARSALDQEISTALADLDSPAELKLDVPGLAEMRQFLSQCQSKLQKGHVADTRDEFDRELPGKLRTISEALTQQTDSLNHAVQAVSDWPELDVSKVLDNLRQALTAFQTTHQDLKKTGEVGKALRALSFLVRRYSQRIITERAPAILALADEVLGKLRDLPASQGSPYLEALTSEIAAYTQATASTISADLTGLLGAEAPLRKAITDALAGAGAAVRAGAPAPATLAAGNYRTALTEVLQAHGVASLGTPTTQQKLSPPAVESIPSDVEGWGVRITTSTAPTVGTALVLSAELIVAEGASAPTTVRTAWWINGAPQQPSGPGGLSCVYKPGPGDGELAVDVEVTIGDKTSRTIRNSAKFLVRVSDDRQLADQLLAEAEAISGWQTVFAGSLIVFAGYTIFQSAFVGSLTDIAAALFWGFGIDLSVAKALEYSTPLTGKKLP